MRFIGDAILQIVGAAYFLAGAWFLISIAARGF
jgi:hypothetical protein